MPTFDVFDCHHHVGDVSAFLGVRPADGPAPPADASAAEDTLSEMARRIEIMDSGGVRQAAVIPSHAYDRPDGIADTRRINDDIAAYRDAQLDRFPVAIGVIEPVHGLRSLDELDRARRELGLVGISFHARFQGISMDNPWILRYVERMGELGLVPVLHAMTESVDEAIWKLAGVARAFPGLPMLVLDAFSTFEGTKECRDVAETCPNLLFDTSLSYNFDFIENFAKRFGADRVVFGTDLYSPPLGRRISHLVPQILESSLSHDDKVKIFGANLRRLFGMS
jgi:predicted TIM-barrel fold metal-dependent hydrolase